MTYSEFLAIPTPGYNPEWTTEREKKFHAATARAFDCMAIAADKKRSEENE